MLQSSEEGSFFVRDSQSRQGCHALTIKVPKEFIPDGYANYLIISTPEGVKLEVYAVMVVQMIMMLMMMI